jgi:hypothetical protein
VTQNKRAVDGTQPVRADHSFARIVNQLKPEHGPRRCTLEDRVRFLSMGLRRSPARRSMGAEMHLAYVRPMSARQARALGLIAPNELLPEHTKLFAVHAADGTPLAITDAMDAALAVAARADLVAVLVH